MNKIKLGDLVRMRDVGLLRDHFSVQYRFRVVGEEIQFVETKDLAGKVGIVVCDKENHMYANGVYHVAFGSTVIRAYQDYFEKVEKSLNKINNRNV